MFEHSQLTHCITYIVDGFLLYLDYTQVFSEDKSKVDVFADHFMEGEYVLFVAVNSRD